MPRPRRFRLTGIPQLVAQRGLIGQTLFETQDDFIFLLHCLRDASDEHGCDIHAYVLLPNSYLALMTPNRPLAISKSMQSAGCHYVQYYNTRHQRRGTLWEGRYRACLVDPAVYLFDCYRYLESYPIRAQLARQANDYPWSSYAWHAHGKRDSLIREHSLYLSLALSAEARCDRYHRDFARYEIDTSTQSLIEDTLTRGWILGSEQFRADVAHLSGASTVLRRRGRPKKCESAEYER